MIDVRIVRMGKKDVVFLGKSLGSIQRPEEGDSLNLWKTKGGKYVFSRLKDDCSEEDSVFDSVQEVSAYVIKGFGEFGKKLLRQAALQDQTFEGATEERIE